MVSPSFYFLYIPQRCHLLEFFSRALIPVPGTAIMIQAPKFRLYFFHIL